MPDPVNALEVRALAAAGIQALLVALLVTPIVRDIFRAYHIVDLPNLRKVHAYPIPRLGGISLLAAFLIGISRLPLPGVKKMLLPGAAIIFLTGLLDDFFNLAPGWKLVGQIAAAVVAYLSGLRAPGPVEISFPLTLFWLVLASNAFNLIDGLDGLCAGTGLIGAVALCVMGALNGNQGLEGSTLALAGGLLGFLFYNFWRATMFLGDSGALLVGFLLGCCGLLWCGEPGPPIRYLAPVLAVSVPLIDALVAVVRRLLARRPIFSADRGHIHHRLLDRGLSATQAVLILYAWSIWGGIFAVLLGDRRLHSGQEWLIVLFLASTLAIIYRLRYSEFKWGGA